MKNILLVEDEKGIARMIAVQLNLVGFHVITVSDLAGALATDLSDIELIILDWMLPDGCGPEIIPRLRQKKELPILMLTARSELVDKLTGFEAGADDYLTKPFDMMELIARIKALLRRQSTAPAPSAESDRVLRFETLTLNTDTRRVCVGDQTVNLTPTEFKILKLLMEHTGKVFSRDELIHSVLGYDYEGYGRTLDSHIARLRNKINCDDSTGHYIKTVFGVGYRLGDEA
ncbi:MAG: DNA-binding response regulator [Calditrichaeota bacterium]|nr:MAG: DNA-binding response regulator [Calditrichota bacterium]